MNLSNIFIPNKHSAETMAEMLRVSPAALTKFEEEYQKSLLKFSDDDFFATTAKDASRMARELELPTEADMRASSALAEKIVNELVPLTSGIQLLGGEIKPLMLPPASDATSEVTEEEVRGIDPRLRPQLTGTMMCVDLNVRKEPSCVAVVSAYSEWLSAKDQKRKTEAYGMFRQGLDLLDLDPVLYQMLGKNPNSMSYWLPPIARAVQKSGFFRIPETRIAKVPMTLLQMSRLDYGSLTPTTLKIVDDWAMRVFDLDVTKKYFIKTGIFSSKYDFRNAKVEGEQEVRELGEYLLYIQHQTVSMAGPLMTPHFYGAATTNEWVVREFIEDTDGEMTIYNGLPLHTEYRCFVDFDKNRVLGVVPYWHPDVMKRRFESMSNPKEKHDYVTYLASEEKLMRRFNENADTIRAEVSKLLPNTDLHGQWSIDIMQNGDTFWLIDMALAHQSALSEFVQGIEGSPEPKWLEGASV